MKGNLALILAVLGLAIGGSEWAIGRLGERKPKEAAQAPVAKSLTGGPTKKEPAVDLYGDPLPPGVIARLGTRKLRAIESKAALSQDGKSILTIRGTQVKVWDATDGKLREQRQLAINLSLSELSDGVYLLSEDGRLIAHEGQGTEATIDVLDIASGKRLDRIPLPDNLNVVAFSPDNKMLAMVTRGSGTEATVRVQDIGVGERLSFKVKWSYSRGVAFSPDGRLLAVTDGALAICWSIPDKREIWRAKSTVELLRFTPDGRALIGAPTYGAFGGIVWQCWDAATGKPDESRRLPEGRGCMGLVVASNNWTMAYCADPTMLGIDHRVRVWDLRTGLLRFLPTVGTVVAFAPDDRSIYTNDGALQRWEVATGRTLLPDTETAGHRTQVFRVVYSRDGRILASSAPDGSIRLWDTAAGRILHIMRTTRERNNTNLAFTSDAARLVSGDTDGDLHIWDTATGKELRRITLHEEKLGEKKQHVHRLHLAPDDKTVLVFGNDPGGNPARMRGTLSSWDLVTGRRSTVAKTEGTDTYYAAFSPDGLTLASRGGLIDVPSGKARLKLNGAGGYLHFYAYSPDGRLVAGMSRRLFQEGNTEGWKPDGSRIWNAASGETVTRLDTDWVGQYAFTPDARYLATASIDGIRLWECLTGNVVLTQQAHEKRRGSYGPSFASCMAMAPNGRSLATGHRDGTILVWSLTPPAGTLAVSDLPRLWAGLAGPDAAKAYQASWQLTQVPDVALSYLRERIKPATAAPREQTGPLLAGLDSQDFKKREDSARQLRALSDRAARAMRQALKANPSLETRLRLEALLKELKSAPAGEALGVLRAVTVLERIGTPAARQLLTRLADGDAEARLTQEAKMSIQRLNATSKAKP